MMNEIHDFFVRLFCRHEWEQYVYNVETNKLHRPLTLAVKNCRKCTGWKLLFVFVNEPKPKPDER